MKPEEQRHRPRTGLDVRVLCMYVCTVRPGWAWILRVLCMYVRMHRMGLDITVLRMYVRTYAQDGPGH
jgi:hypothetical protein